MSSLPAPADGVRRVPAQYTTINDAIAAASPGDTIAVSAGVYHESVSVPASKPGLRLLATSSRVVLDGGTSLGTAFYIDANIVTVKGFAIRRYRTSGITVPSVTVSGTRLLDNRIETVTQGSGIVLGGLIGLLYRNVVSCCSHAGIVVAGKDNYVLENRSERNGGAGILLETFGNHVIANTVRENGGDGVRDEQGQNLLYENEVAQNAGAGIREQGAGGALLASNRVSRNDAGGIVLASSDNILWCNTVEQCGRAPAVLATSFAQTIESNQVIGGDLELQSVANLVVRNRLCRGARIVVTPPSLLPNVLLWNAGLPPVASPDLTSTAALLRVPSQFPTVSAAIAAASPGDTILVAPGTYAESVLVPADKISLRLLAEPNTVRPVLAGAGSDPALVVEAPFVLVEGFEIRGAALRGSVGARLIDNIVSGVEGRNGGDAVTLDLTFSTLLGQNELLTAPNRGVAVTGMNSWILRNEVRSNVGDGIDFTQPSTYGNAVVDNRVHHNGSNGVLDHAGPNLLYRNRLSENGADGVLEAAGGQGVANLIANEITSNRRYGVEILTPAPFVADNVVKGNGLGAVYVHSASGEASIAQ